MKPEELVSQVYYNLVKLLIALCKVVFLLWTVITKVHSDA